MYAKEDLFVTMEPLPELGINQYTIECTFQGMHLSFSEPQKTAVCIRRKSRRRVLFALSKAGKGKRPTRRPRWTEKSYIRCK